MNPLNKEILRLALPSMVSNITVPLLGLCDVTIMGHVGGAESIAAIAVGSMIFNVMYWLFAFLRMSTSGLTAQAFGAGRQQECRHILHHSLRLALVVALAIVVLQVPLQWLTFWLTNATGDVARLCMPYFYICVWGAPAVLGLYVVMGWLVGMQDTRRPMMIAIGQNVMNIATSVVLVLGFDMGLTGVAIGTLTAQWAGFAMGLGCVRKKNSPPAPLRLERGVYTPCGNNKGKDYILPSPIGEGPGVRLKGLGVRLKRPGVRLEGLLSVALFLRTLCLVGVNLWFTSAGAAQGALTLAANTLLMQLFMLFSYVMDGFANAGEALAGRFTGAADEQMLGRCVRQLFAWGGGAALLFTIAYLLGGPLILGLLTSDGAVVAAACHYLPWAVAIPAAGTAAFVWDGIFIGTTRATGMLFACFWGAVVFFALWLLLAGSMGNHGLWLAFIMFLLMRGGVQTWLYRKRN